MTSLLQIALWLRKTIDLGPLKVQAPAELAPGPEQIYKTTKVLGARVFFDPIFLLFI
jgi:hypothetical protein